MPGLSIEEMTIGEAQVSLGPHLERFRGGLERWSPHHDPSYLALWERILGLGSACRILVAWDRSGELAAYAPLMRVRGHVGPVPVPALRFIGNNIGYPGDVLYSDVFSPAREPDAVSAILGHVASTWALKKWELGYLPLSSPTWRAAAKILRDGFVASGARAVIPFLSLRLPETWDSYLASLTANTRSSYRRGLRRLDARGGLRVLVDRTSEGARNRVDELIRNHRRWLAGTEREGWFGDEAVRTFLVSSAGLLAHEGRFFASTLELDGEPIAWIVGPSRGEACYLQLSSYDRRYADDSPGLVLGLELMRELISGGTSRVALGPGTSLFKKRLGGVEEPYRRALGYQGWTRRVSALVNWSSGSHGVRVAHPAPASGGAGGIGEASALHP